MWESISLGASGSCLISYCYCKLRKGIMASVRYRTLVKPLPHSLQNNSSNLIHCCPTPSLPSYLYSPEQVRKSKSVHTVDPSATDACGPLLNLTFRGELSFRLYFDVLSQMRFIHCIIAAYVLWMLPVNWVCSVQRLRGVGGPTSCKE